MNYAEDRLDRRARSSENDTTEGSTTTDQLACDLKCAHDVLIFSSSVDTTKQSTTYETRLIKYASRGFSVAIPSFPRLNSSVSP